MLVLRFFSDLKMNVLRMHDIEHANVSVHTAMNASCGNVAGWFCFAFVFLLTLVKIVLLLISVKST